MIANLVKALQSALKSISSSVFETETEAYLNQHWALGSRVLLAFQTLAERQSTSLLSPLEQLESVIDVIAKTFDFPLAFIEQHNAEAETLEIVAAFGIASSTQHKPTPLAQQTLSGMVITTQAPTIWSELQDPVVIPQLKDIELFADRFCTVVSIPLLYEQETVGVLTLAHPDCQPVEKYVIHWLSSVAASVASTLAYVQLAQRQSQVQERLDLAALGLHGIIYDLDLEQRQMLRTQGIVNLLGYNESEVVPSLAWWLNRVHPEDRPALEIFLAQEAQNHREFSLTYRVRRINDQYLTVCDRGVVMRDASGDPIRLIGTITEQTYGLDQLHADLSDSASTAFLNRQNENENIQDVSAAAPLPLLPQPHTTSVSPLLHPSTILDRLQDVIFQTDRDGKWTFLNLAWSTLTGFSVEETLGQRWQDFIHPDDVLAQEEAFVSVLNQASAAIAELHTQSPHPESVSTYPQLRYITKAGETRWVEVHCQPLLGMDRSVTGTTGTLYDITNRKSAEVQLLHDAMHDSLTGLPNRVLFRDRLEQAMERARRGDHGLSLMFLDLDRFKVINDSLGHEVGDLLLIHVAKLLTHTLRGVDTVARSGVEASTVSRLGGDEFTIIVEGLKHGGAAADIAERILKALATPFVHLGQDIYISTSIGISLYPADDTDLDGLIRHTDMAMYRSKDLGRNTYNFYSDDMNASVAARLALEASLRHALERGEFALHYQPKINLGTGTVSGVEALIRWNRPGLGMVAPDFFISALEDTGMIVPVGAWVIQTACAEIASWDQLGLPTLSLAVNLSARQFRQQDLAEMIGKTLDSTGLPAHRLELELTESLLMEDNELSSGVLARFAQMGLRVAIDDFGTGHSSLSYLKRFNVDTLKIDRSFVRDTPDDLDDCAIATAIVALAHSLKLKVVAEGVETREQLMFLRGLGCDEMQGYLISRPLPAPQLISWLQSYRSQEYSRALLMQEPAPVLTEGKIENQAHHVLL